MRGFEILEPPNPGGDAVHCYVLWTFAGLLGLFLAISAMICHCLDPTQSASP